MKKINIIWISALLLILTGCSSDDEIVIEKDEHGGIVYSGYAYQDIDESDPLSVFFGEELHNPYWDDSGNEYKTFFEQGKWDDETILVINNQKEFQEAYMGTKNLPIVDFNMYTLVIGRTWGYSCSCKLSEIILNDNSLNYELETKIYHYVDRLAPAAIEDIFYWRLYPKLALKPIIPKRTMIDVHG